MICDAQIANKSTSFYPGILEIYFSICLIWSTICGVVGFNALALRKKSLAARREFMSLLFIMRTHLQVGGGLVFFIGQALTYGCPDIALRLFQIIFLHGQHSHLQHARA